MSNNLGSNGHIAYRIKPLSSVSIGDKVKNQASIFFDLNPPIITNEVETEFVKEILSVQDAISSSFKLSPIPASTKLNIHSKTKIRSIEVLNFEGKTLLSNLNKSDISIKTLPVGIYLCKITDFQDRTEFIKFIKN